MMTWKNIQGWFDWQHIYERMAVEVPMHGTIVELGVWRGCSIAFLAEKLKLCGKPNVRLVGIDNFVGGDDTPKVYYDLKEEMKEPVIDECRRNLAGCGLSDQVELIEDDVVNAARHFADGSVTFLFIDSNHTPAHLRRELTAWLPKMKRPTWIAGHDIHGTYLREAVVEFFPDYTIDGSCWVGRLK